MSNYHRLFTASAKHTALAKLKEVRDELNFLTDCEKDPDWSKEPERVQHLAFCRDLERVLVEETAALRTDPNVSDEQLFEQNEIVEARTELFSTATAELAATGTLSVDTILRLRRDSDVLNRLLTTAVEIDEGEGKIARHPLISHTVGMLLKATVPDDSLETRLARKLPASYGLVRDIEV